MDSNSKIILTAAACLLVGGVVGNFLPLGKTGAVDEAKVKAIVADYIAQNPEKIVESLQGLQEKAANEHMDKLSEAVKANKDAILQSSDSPTAGGDTSGITLVEFFDYHCGYCKKMSGTIAQFLTAHPDVKLVFKEFPILSEDSHTAAQAALAVHFLAPKRYTEFHMMLMKHSGEFSQEALNDYAGQVGVNVVDFEKEMQSERVQKELQATQDLAMKLGVQGTPALIIGEELIPGAIPFDALDAKIKALKEQKKS